MMKRMLLPIALCMPLSALADNASLTAFFDNDSINPFQFVDAYETHMMGIKYQNGTHRFGLEAAIVSPDMIVYSNVYRVANRSYGELLRLSYEKAMLINLSNVEIGGYIVAAGKFDLDRIQQQLHETFRLQDTFRQVQPIRMPDELWFGVTGNLSTELATGSPYRQVYAAQLGSDRIAFMGGVERDIALGQWDGAVLASLEAVFRDEIVSAPPISSEFRELVPRLGIAVSRRFGNATVSLGETLSLPTIASDDRARAVFNASLAWHFD